MFLMLSRSCLFVKQVLCIDSPHPNHLLKEFLKLHSILDPTLDLQPNLIGNSNSVQHIKIKTNLCSLTCPDRTRSVKSTVEDDSGMRLGYGVSRWPPVRAYPIAFHFLFDALEASVLAGGAFTFASSSNLQPSISNREVASSI